MARHNWARIHRECIQAAHEADPDTKLLYNDYNLDQEGKLDFALNMIKDFKKGISQYMG